MKKWLLGCVVVLHMVACYGSEQSWSEESQDSIEMLKKKEDLIWQERLAKKEKPSFVKCAKDTIYLHRKKIGFAALISLCAYLLYARQETGGGAGEAGADEYQQNQEAGKVKVEPKKIKKKSGDDERITALKDGDLFPSRLCFQAAMKSDNNPAGISEEAFREKKPSIADLPPAVLPAQFKEHSDVYLEVITLEHLCHTTNMRPGYHKQPRFTILEGAKVEELQANPAYANSVFQVASTQNILESGMRQGGNLTNYLKGGAPQGQAASLGCMGAAIWRAYYAPPVDLFGEFDAPKGMVEKEAGMAKIAVAIQRNAVVTSGKYIDNQIQRVDNPDQQVTQVFASAFNMKASGTKVPTTKDGFVSKLLKKGKVGKEEFAKICLNASYEATLRAALLVAPQAGVQTKVVLTFLGGGVFDNQPSWIESAIKRNAGLIKEKNLHVVLVCYPKPSATVKKAWQEWATGQGFWVDPEHINDAE